MVKKGRKKMNFIKKIIDAKNKEEAVRVAREIIETAWGKYMNCGRTIFLPYKCSIGDEAYFIIEDIDKTYISTQKITDISTKGFFVSASVEDEEDSSEFISFSEVGKTVFLNQ